MSSEQPRVLVVEDNALDRALLQAHLHGLPADIAFAGDGVEAWEMLDRDATQYDVILLDRTMPRMNGLELLARLKADPRCRTIPVILQTGSVGREEMIEGINAGAYYYLTKPYDVDMLKSVVRTAVADHQAYREMQLQVKKGFDSLRLLEKAVFTFQTVEQARDLGTLLANTCPDPSATVIGLTELLVNAVEHGNLGITYEDKSRLSDSAAWNEEVCRRMAMPEHATKRAEVSFERGVGQLRFTIRDQGTGFDWKRYLQVDPQRAFDTHGRGIAMANRLSFSNIEYRGCGNEVVGVVVCK